MTDPSPPPPTPRARRAGRFSRREWLLIVGVPGLLCAVIAGVAVGVSRVHPPDAAPHDPTPRMLDRLQSARAGRGGERLLEGTLEGVDGQTVTTPYSHRDVLAYAARRTRQRCVDPEHFRGCALETLQSDFRAAAMALVTPQGRYRVAGPVTEFENVALEGRWTAGTPQTETLSESYVVAGEPATILGAPTSAGGDPRFEGVVFLCRGTADAWIGKETLTAAASARRDNKSRGAVDPAGTGPGWIVGVGALGWVLLSALLAVGILARRWWRGTGAASTR